MKRSGTNSVKPGVCFWRCAADREIHHVARSIDVTNITVEVVGTPSECGGDDFDHAATVDFLW